MVERFVRDELPGLLDLRRRAQAGEVVDTAGTKGYLADKGTWEGSGS